jgi:hypothetical protein
MEPEHDQGLALPVFEDHSDEVPEIVQLGVDYHQNLFGSILFEADRSTSVSYKQASSQRHLRLDHHNKLGETQVPKLDLLYHLA